MLYLLFSRMCKLKNDIWERVGKIRECGFGDTRDQYLKSQSN